MQHVITLIPGDGIGPEVTKPTLKIIKAAGVKVKWETHLAGAEALKKHGTTIPKQLMHSFEKIEICRCDYPRNRALSFVRNACRFCSCFLPSRPS